MGQQVMSEREKDGGDLVAAVRAMAATIDAGIVGPFEVKPSPGAAGSHVRYEVRAHWLVPVDPDRSDLTGVCVPVPVSGSVVLAADGSLERGAIESPTGEDAREARLFAQDLIAQGAVRGLAPGVTTGPLGGRPTHQLEPGPQGSRVIRRIGFSAGGAGSPSR